jgi:hypothetical protein
MSLLCNGGKVNQLQSRVAFYSANACLRRIQIAERNEAERKQGAEVAWSRAEK